MRRTGIVWDDRFCVHDTGPGHPERPERLHAIHAAIQSAGLPARTVRVPVAPADRSIIEAIHDPEYIERVERACDNDRRCIDTPDSTICAESFEIARCAVGGCLAAVDRVLGGEIDNAFCAVRPPGHHAEHDRSMGFCLFNNIAIAADYLRKHHGLNRVLILDWDVHHGNGTQHAFEADPTVFFCSMHEHPRYLYPGTGYPHEVGHGAAEGTTLNLTFLPQAIDHDYKVAYDDVFVPAARAFRPEFILVSAGFDAHMDDPLATLDLSDEGFAWLADRTMALADELCGGRVVSILEGGYHLDVLTRCVTRHVEILLQDEHAEVPDSIGKSAGESEGESEMRRASREARPDVIWWW